MSFLQHKKTLRSFFANGKIRFTLILLLCFPGTVSASSAFTFVDTDGDLLADSPDSPEKFIDPDVLVYTTSPEAEKENLSERHSGRMAFIAEETGKKVVFLETASSLEEIEKMRDGELHIAGFSTGTLGFAVNLAGFVPVCMIMHYHVIAHLGN